jgi:hypothetical protein
MTMVTATASGGEEQEELTDSMAFLPPELLFQLLKRLGAHFFTPFLQAERTPCDSNGDFLHACILS